MTLRTAWTHVSVHLDGAHIVAALSRPEVGLFLMASVVLLGGCL
ncbi:hypothetical protein GCM10008955_00700 [Deinococcus malanensis]|uniref:Uncharacterized protein n=1 Tax=Deinococcus malanensis TaxID=1706855 RepID=A0ABQ2EHA6_9DEIO|nr:hypothetical protein [Deinococcus malanensis]GGK11330.1 hypothetical protein GCM10008955_00700 [Deinococcus malanensis]